MTNLLRDISDWSNRFVEIVGSLLTCVLVIVITSEVIARYVLNSSLTWSEEFGRILFVWVIFLGASIAYKRGAHMGLHFITEKTSTPVKRLLSIISLLLSSVFFIFIGVEGVMVTLKMTTQLTPAMEVSMAWQFSAIPVGAFLMLLHVPGLLTQSEKAGVPHDLDSSM